MSQEYVADLYEQGIVADTTLQNMEKNFASLKSAFSGATTPSNTIAGMWWFDTTSNILKLRNEANNAWQSVWDFANNKPVITNLSNEITNTMCAAALKDPATGTAGLRTLGTGSTQACAGNDSRLSDARTPADASVTQAKLKTSTQEQSYSLPQNTWHTFTLTGGYYCFLPRYKCEVVRDANIKIANSISLNTVYSGPYVAMHQDGDGRTFYVKHYYVTSSGEVFWVFLLRNKKGDIIASSACPDHPSFNNDTKIEHPFTDVDLDKFNIEVINPTTEQVKLIEKHRRYVKSEEFVDSMFDLYTPTKGVWPTKKITVKLEKYDEDGNIINYMNPELQGKPCKTIKKVIPKPDYIKIKSLKRIK